MPETIRTEATPPIPTEVLTTAIEEAWRIAVCYGELVPDDAKRLLSVSGLTPHMTLNKAQIGTVVTRIVPILLAAAAESRIEYGTRITWDDGAVEDMLRGSREAAETTVALHVRRRTEDPGHRATAKLIQRTITTGPWREA